MKGRAVRRCAWAAALTLVALVVWACRPLSPYQEELVRKGFPESYVDRLEDLHERHPNWIFEPLAVTDLTWMAVLDKECSPGWNLVVRSKWAPGVWKDKGYANYRPYYAKNAKAYDSGAWYQASRAAVAYFMDPRSFLNESDVFMFETLAFDARAQTRAAVERTLEGSFMHKATYDDTKRTFSELVCEVGQRLRVSPVFLAGRLKSEQGAGTVQAKGRIGDSLLSLATNAADRVKENRVWGGAFARDGADTAAIVAAGAEVFNGYYNFFNIGACGTGLFEIRFNAFREAVSEETCRRYGGPWTTQAKAIAGGARKVKELYVDGGRSTRYLQKFSVSPQAGRKRWLQYMQNIAAPLQEARSTSKAYREAGLLDLPFTFVIPVYRDMPAAPSSDPADGDSVYSPSTPGG